MSRTHRVTPLLLILVMLTAPLGSAWAGQLPDGFVHAADVVPGLVEEMRYHGRHNFVGRPVDGYEAPRCILTRQAAEALAKVQAELRPMGLQLKVYDCYRPQRAVDHFARWADDLDDRLTKAEFYPTVAKDTLHEQGYIARRSSHSRGGAVDLTIIPLPAPPQPAYDPARQEPCFAPAGRRWADNSLDMGVGFDCFHELSHTANPAVGPQQRANRALLRSLMDRHGFENYSKEWWHFTLRDEPHPDTYFNFPVR